MTTNIAKEGGLALVINFSAGVIVSEFDDMLMWTGRVQKIREYFDELKDTLVSAEKTKTEEEMKILRERKRKRAIIENKQGKKSSPYSNNEEDELKESEAEKNARYDSEFDPVKID